ncbi:hypothetical protein [Polaromonas sp. DSR2-3-2]|uniref:hypothetical protein n=1 Tax=unclassified Polaromonas TaxID=2638319 RepID=UPI003CF732B4
MKLLNHFRSSKSFRVRIALELKGLAYDHAPVQITRCEHRKAPCAALSANALGRARVRAPAQPSACPGSQA